MSIVANPALAPLGVRKMEWVRDFMPVLSGIQTRFEKEKPLAGLRIAVSVHLEAKTAYLGTVLQAGGAQVYLTGSNPLSTQDDVAAGLASLGVETFGIHGVSEEEYERLLLEALACQPHIVIDDGGDLIDLLCTEGKGAQYAGALIGGCEETTTGILRLKARERAGCLPCAMMAVNDAKSKHYYDNQYGTGQSVWDAVMHTTNLLVAGKTVVVAGFGYCGRGVAMRAAGLGARVIVTEVDPFKALDAVMQGYDVMPMDEAAALGDYFVTVTGCRDVITKAHFLQMKDNAFVMNAGHFDVEVDVKGLARMAVSHKTRRENIAGYTMENGRTVNVIAQGRLVNLAAGNGHPAEIMDMSFAVQALSAVYLAQHRDTLEKKLYDVPKELDDQIAQVKLRAMGKEIDGLTEDQASYLNGFTV